MDLANAELSDSAAAGRLLGYPECCVEAISVIAGASSQWALHLLRGHAAPVDARLNRFAAEWGGIGLLGELFPCSLHCRAAAAYAQSLYDAMTSIGMRKLADAARADALTPVDISPQGRISRATSGGSVEFYW
jgi:hypothetical protein